MVVAVGGRELVLEMVVGVLIDLIFLRKRGGFWVEGLTKHNHFYLVL